MEKGELEELKSEIRRLRDVQGIIVPRRGRDHRCAPGAPCTHGACPARGCRDGPGT